MARSYSLRCCSDNGSRSCGLVDQSSGESTEDGYLRSTGSFACGFDARLGIEPVLFPLKQVFASQHLFRLLSLRPTAQRLRFSRLANALVPLSIAGIMSAD